MTVFCAKCGTELLGAVNRCWKCGLPVVSSADASPLPPVRRPPVRGPLDLPPWEAMSAEVIDEPSAANATSVTEAEARAGERRRGSPFSTGHRGTPVASSALPAPSFARAAASGVGQRWRSLRQRWTATTPTASGAKAGIFAAAAGALMGSGAFSLRDYPELALSLALVGLLLAALGFVLGARLPAGVASLLCILALLWSSYQLAMTLYERRFGRSPWEDDAEEWEEPPTEPLGPR